MNVSVSYKNTFNTQQNILTIWGSQHTFPSQIIQQDRLSIQLIFSIGGRVQYIFHNHRVPKPFLLCLQHIFLSTLPTKSLTIKMTSLLVSSLSCILICLIFRFPFIWSSPWLANVQSGFTFICKQIFDLSFSSSKKFFFITLFILLQAKLSPNQTFLFCHPIFIYCGSFYLMFQLKTSP